MLKIQEADICQGAGVRLFFREAADISCCGNPGGKGLVLLWSTSTFCRRKTAGISFHGRKCCDGSVSRKKLRLSIFRQRFQGNLKFSLNLF